MPDYPRLIDSPLIRRQVRVGKYSGELVDVRVTLEPDANGVEQLWASLKLDADRARIVAIDSIDDIREETAAR